MGTVLNTRRRFFQRTVPIEAALSKYSNKKKAKVLQSFFKTGPGQYAEGDIFLGVSVPRIRQIAKIYQEIPLNEAEKLLKSSIHEERLLALLLFLLKYKSNPSNQNRIYRVYLNNTKYINNWDLVDLTASHIVGAYLVDKDRKVLIKLAKSKNLWERRISIISTFHFIRINQFKDTLKIAKVLLLDTEDLIHKAVGWMLREVGKRDLAAEEAFLKNHYLNMPRTMLRYAIERFPELKRQAYLKGKK